MKKHKVDTVVLPAFLATALINGDMSGLEDDDERWVEAAVKYIAPARFIDVGEAYFSNYCDLPGYRLAADMAEYTILYDNEFEDVEEEVIELDVDDVLDGYLEAALFTGTDETDPDSTGGEPLDKNYSTDDFSKATVAKARKDVEKFLGEMEIAIAMIHDEFEAADKMYEAREYDSGNVGHDFWMTRNGHGVGFWDRPDEMYGKRLAKELTSISKKYGEVYTYIGDDGEIHIG